ncbi:MAG: hypothetical protein AABO57_04780 [Acidobacteriota bacterium]
MNTKNTVPGFTAEASLYKARADYRMNASNLVGVETNIIPQLRIVAGAPGKSGELKSICAQIGAIVNEFYQDSVNPNNSSSEQQEARDVARQMYNRSRGSCSFGVIP